MSGILSVNYLTSPIWVSLQKPKKEGIIIIIVSCHGFNDCKDVKMIQF